MFVSRPLLWWNTWKPDPRTGRRSKPARVRSQLKLPSFLTGMRPGPNSLAPLSLSLPQGFHLQSVVLGAVSRQYPAPVLPPFYQLTEWLQANMKLTGLIIPQKGHLKAESSHCPHHHKKSYLATVNTVRKLGLSSGAVVLYDSKTTKSVNEEDSQGQAVDNYLQG